MTMQNLLWSRFGLLGLFSIFIFILPIAAQFGLYQEYCSPDNTGAYYQKFYDTYQSDGSCQTHCDYDGTFAFAVVQGYYCWCSNYIPANQVSLSDCDFPCHGFPAEACGNPDSNLFGYIPLSNSPYGTAGAASTSTQAPSQSSRPNRSQGAQTTSAVRSIRVSSKKHDSSSVEYSAAATASASSTASSTPTSSPTPSSSSVQPSAVTSVVEVTVSGAVVTHVITTVATAAPGSNSLPHVSAAGSPGLSSGAVAGIAIGVLIAVGLIVSLCIFFCWYRPRRDRDDDEDDDEGDSRHPTPPHREPNMLNRVGILGSRPPIQPAPPLPRIRTSGFGGRITEPTSIDTVSPTMSQRRNSQPMFIDSRLNTNPIMTQSNVSHTSVSTLQDHQDYSRPVLSVRNPDLYEGT